MHADIVAIRRPCRRCIVFLLADRRDSTLSYFLSLPTQDKKEKVLCKLRERHGLVDQINLDLTYAVCFNLANCYHQNGMKKEVKNL